MTWTIKDERKMQRLEQRSMEALERAATMAAEADQLGEDGKPKQAARKNMLATAAMARYRRLVSQMRVHTLDHVQANDGAGLEEALNAARERLRNGATVH